MSHSDGFVENPAELHALPDETITADGPTAEIDRGRVSPHQEVRDKGWIERTPFNYDDLNSKDGHEWAGTAARYEWKEEYEQAIGPRNEELEKMLFESELLPRAGLRVAEVTSETAVVCDSEDTITPVKEWDDAGLHPVMRENVRLCLYDKPTAIQTFAIPAISQGKDLIGIAHTGSGKTGAFLIPILSDLMGKAKKLAAPRPSPLEEFDSRIHGVTAEPLVLIVCPTRELATQIFDEARRLCYRSMLRPCVAYGGAPIVHQRQELMKGCDILIGTPGRIIDFMTQPNVLSLRRVRYTVIDEADELLHSDWHDDFKKIMSGGDMNEDDDHRYMMFSASFNKECRQLAREYLMKDYIRVRVGRPGSSHLMVEQSVIYCEDSAKKECLYDLMMSRLPCRTLIFVNSKAQVDFVDDYLFNRGMPSTSIHGDRTQREREDAIRAFRSAACPILVATGLSARGLDVANVMHVINFDLPKAMHGGITEYIHRIGRTARIGNEGIATSFYNKRDEELAYDLVKILLETNQVIPDFLEAYRPEDNEVKFDDDTDNEDDNQGGDDAASNAGSNFSVRSAKSAKSADEDGDKPAWNVEEAVPGGVEDW
ncbi:ATP-dependent RNA helicase ded1 [Penicillium lividum]|nr:ATP-dependent RNA helicase ded1 [Penicillium lividum]